MKTDPVQLINETEGPFWICGLARELWPVLIDRLDELTDSARMAVVHYAAESVLGRKLESSAVK